MDINEQFESKLDILCSSLEHIDRSFYNAEQLIVIDKIKSNIEIRKHKKQEFEALTIVYKQALEEALASDEVDDLTEAKIHNLCQKRDRLHREVDNLKSEILSDIEVSKILNKQAH